MGWPEQSGEARLTSPQEPRRRILPTGRRFLWLPVAGGVAGVVAYTFVFGESGYLRERALRRELRSLRQEIHALREEAKELHGVVRGLQEGGVEIERIGREQLGLVRPGEVTYRLVPIRPHGSALDTLGPAG